MLIALSVPGDNERGPQYMEQVLDAIHRLRAPVSFEFGRHEDTVTLYCRCRDYLESSLTTQLRSVYPDLRLTTVPENALAMPVGSRSFGQSLRVRSHLYTLKCWPEFVDKEQRNHADPAAGILAALTDQSLYMHVAIRARPASSLRRFLFFLHRLLYRRHAEKQKTFGHLFSVGVRITVSAPALQRQRARRKRREIAATFGRYNRSPFAEFRRVWVWPRRSLLTSQELATLWHPPTDTVQTDTRETTTYRRLEPPVGIRLKRKEREAVTTLGRIDYHGRNEVFGLDVPSRMRHVYVSGKTGVGKSTLLENQIVADMQAGHGVGVIDPHGDLADRVRALVPRHRTNDVIDFDASDRNFPVSFNPLSFRSEADRPLVSSGTIAAFKKVFDLEHAPRLEHILRNTVAAVLYHPGCSFLSIHRMLVDEEFRSHVVGLVSDPLVRDFWLKEFANWTPRYRDEAIPALQNKLGPFLTNPLIRHIVGQQRGTIDLREIMDEGKILIVNLSKGKLGEDNSAFLGSLLVTKFQLDVMSRADIPERERRPFFLSVDEFQNFATASFSTMLSEARKYGLGLTLANQFVKQIVEEGTDAAVFGNVGTIVAFQCGSEDAELLSQQFAGVVRTEDLIAIPPFHAYVRLHGNSHRPFSMQTLPPQHIHPGTLRPQRIRRVSRRHYARPVEKVEREIRMAFMPQRQAVVS